MRKPVIVDSPYPTVWETAEKMGVSRKRTKEIIKMVDEVMARRDASRAAARKRRLKTA
jgi:hypothetical protein